MRLSSSSPSRMRNDSRAALLLPTMARLLAVGRVYPSARETIGSADRWGLEVWREALGKKPKRRAYRMLSNS